MMVVIKRGMSRQRIRLLMNKLHTGKRKLRKAVDVYKYVGVLKEEVDPVELQRQWRGEW
jgi:hypothetical protein